MRKDTEVESEEDQPSRQKLELNRCRRRFPGGGGYTKGCFKKKQKPIIKFLLSINYYSDTRETRLEIIGEEKKFPSSLLDSLAGLIIKST